jgi:hypothetical protein
MILYSEESTKYSSFVLHPLQTMYIVYEQVLDDPGAREHAGVHVTACHGFV